MVKQQKPKKTVKSTTKKSETDYIVPLKKGPRKLKTPKQKFPRNIWPFKRRKKYPKVVHHPIPSAFILLGRSIDVLLKNWKLFLGISAIYAVLELIFVRAFTVTLDLSTVKSDLSSVVHGHVHNIFSGLGQLAGILVGTTDTSATSAGTFQSILIVVGSLAVVWSLRQVYSGIIPRAKDGWYKGTYPIVPVFLVLVTIAVQLLPFAAGITIGVIIDNGGIAINLFEKIIGALIALGISGLSIYWFCSSLFALYVVTLPELTPMTALRVASDLVRRRRLIILRKILFLPIVLSIAIVILMTPLVLFVTPAASWVFFLLTVILLPIVHSYFYTTYRELL